ncbi:MAG: PDC sensor domain-containing protein [Methanocorpusculum sp.]|nr:PDC sensor domain-containing protein [Methanocorpusculum sp.]
MYKHFLILILVSVICFSAGCINTPPLYLAEETSIEVADSILVTLKATVSEAKTAADSAALGNMDEYSAKQALAVLYQRAPLVHDLLIADENGIVVAAYPDNIHIQKGMDLSAYPPNKETFTETDIYLSEYMTAQNGQKVYLLSVPIKIDGKYAGYVSLSFDPYRLFGEKQQEISEKGLGLMVTQTDGILVYDRDIWESGKNSLTDPAYTDIQKTISNVCGNVSGHDFYSFYADETAEVVNKEIWWQTVSFGERDWRVAITQEA